MWWRLWLRSHKRKSMALVEPPCRYKKARHSLSGTQSAGPFKYATFIRASVKVVGGSASVSLARGIAKELPARVGDVSLERHPVGLPAIGRYLKSAKIDAVLAPDQGALRLAKEASTIAGVPFDSLVKKRIDSYTVEIGPKALAVKGKSVGIVDDVISTGGTIAMAAKELRAQGAKRVIAACVHGL